MKELKKQRETILTKISKLNSKIFDLQNKLLHIEQQMINSDHKVIMDTMTLNEQQLEIVNSNNDNTLVIASAGAGKTHTLISMYIKFIVQDKINPSNVIMITFTKKAGQEMAGRLSSLIPSKLPIYIGSLHGLAYKILQEYYNINYTVLDDKDTRELIKTISNSILNIDDEVTSIIKTKISLIIDQASSIFPFNLENIIKKHNLESVTDKIKLIYDKYQNKKKQENIVDFNDLMLMFATFLDNTESNIFKEKIKFIFFDEYQDINPIQHYILLKFKNYSKIIVVGDDAQSIYSFRGSSVNFILNFPNEFENNRMYLLENNYRSTKRIVNFFQNIIKNNTNQYEKNVKSTLIERGIKPTIIGFENNIKRDEWIINDIIKNKNNNVPLSKMVILARKNELLDKIEIELVKCGITVLKHTGISILDKSHVKDFLAFITILINNKSSLHWKRILSLHVGVNQAHEIVEYNTNIKETIEKLKNTQVSYANQLKELDVLLSKINMSSIKDIDKARYILLYLENIWHQKNDNDLIEKSKDILLLINYLDQSNLNDFINELYLNQSIENNLDNTLYLTTIHGSKGLEWDYVYLIDIDSNNFPNTKLGYYINECDEIEEERRLFYVACSRAKYNLVITYNYYLQQPYIITMSPFIREIDPKYYNGIGMIFKSYEMSGIIAQDVNNYLKFYGYSKITSLIKNLKCEKIKLHDKINIPKYLDKFKYSKFIICNFIHFLISKIIQINFTKQVKKFKLNINHKLSDFPQKIKQNYIDELNDWRNLLNDIFFISTFKQFDKDNIFDQINNFLINDDIYEHYNLISSSLTLFINSLNPNEIINNYNVSHGNAKAEINLLIDDTIIEIKPNQNEITTTSLLLQTLFNGYLANKKGKKINKIILYNPLLGELNIFDTSTFNYKELANILYKHFT